VRSVSGDRRCPQITTGGRRRSRRSIAEVTPERPHGPEPRVGCGESRHRTTRLWVFTASPPTAMAGQQRCNASTVDTTACASSVGGDFRIGTRPPDVVRRRSLRGIRHVAAALSRRDRRGTGANKVALVRSAPTRVASVRSAPDKSVSRRLAPLRWRPARFTMPTVGLRNPRVVRAVWTSGSGWSGASTASGRASSARARS